MEEKKGRVIKAVASRCKVTTEDGATYNCFIRGRLKLDIDIYVGDIVQLGDIKGNTAVITKIFPRENVLIRPYISNINKLIIVVAPIPQPDWMLIDKLIINCYQQDIEPVLCINKAELLSDEDMEKWIADYRDELHFVRVSCEDGEIGLNQLYSHIDKHLVCLAGQSAVGKSSIINKLLDRTAMLTGELSKKIERGKNTTRHIEIFPFGDGFLVDTCGFSLFELSTVKSSDLRLYYGKYVDLAKDCKYRMCNHISEPECAVKDAVSKGILSKSRYDRYVEIYKQLKKKEDAQYD